MSEPRADIHLIWEVVEQCNFKCSYCIAGSNLATGKPEAPPLEDIARVIADSPRTLEVNLVGGEPSIVPGFLELCKIITERHYLFLSTNLARDHIFERFAAEIPPERITGIDASFHVEERERISSFEKFARTFLQLRDAGFHVFGNYVAHPRILHRIEDDLARLEDLGVSLEPLPFIGHYEGRPYPESYDERERALVRHEVAYAGKWEAQSHEEEIAKPCNAGVNVFYVRRDGTVTRCSSFPDHTFGNLFEGLEEPDTELFQCRATTCSCPFYSVLPHYFAAAEAADEARRVGPSQPLRTRSSDSCRDRDGASLPSPG